MLHVNRNECVAVNCVAVMHKALHDENGAALASFLSLLRSANPEIVVSAEKEVELNKQTWEMRLVASIQYYSAVFDALGSCLPENSAARIKVEEMFAREMRNVVACEGNERVERYERFNTWKQLMEDGGFRCGGIGEREVLQSRMILRMNSPPPSSSSENYSVEQQGESSDGITLKWMDQPLYTVSAWILADVVAGTSSTAQPS
ncbi:scarecrow-like protein 28 [Typha latifolia]|uniref:scarecrow-like protein 28 n=1 Tax=Typha latifolia TaxID=4733 RepID=UPI003C2E840C